MLCGLEPFERTATVNREFLEVRTPYGKPPVAWAGKTNHETMGDEFDESFNKMLASIAAGLGRANAAGKGGKGGKGAAKAAGNGKDKKASTSLAGKGSGRKRALPEDGDELSDGLSISDFDRLIDSPPPKKTQGHKKGGAFNSSAALQPVLALDGFDEYENDMKDSFTRFLKTGENFQHFTPCKSPDSHSKYRFRLESGCHAG